MIKLTLRGNHSLQTLKERLGSALKTWTLPHQLRNLTKLAIFSLREAKMAKLTLISMWDPASTILSLARKRRAEIMCPGKPYIKTA
jgi:hypothetical protein